MCSLVVNKFKLICVLGVKPKFRNLKSHFGDLEIHNIVFVALQVFVFMQVFYKLCVIIFLLCFGLGFLRCCKWLHFHLYMVYHSNLFVMCYICDDNDNCKCQCGSAQQKKNKQSTFFNFSKWNLQIWFFLQRNVLKLLFY